MKKWTGYLLSSDQNEHAKELAELFCVLHSEDQALFFNEVAIWSRKWEGDRVFQWRDMQRGLSADGKRVIDELSEHTSVWIGGLRIGATPSPTPDVFEPLRECLPLRVEESYILSKRDCIATIEPDERDEDPDDMRKRQEDRAAALAHAANHFDDMRGALDKIAMVISYIVVHGVVTQPEPVEGCPQPVRVSAQELDALIHKIGDTARAILAKVGG